MSSIRSIPFSLGIPLLPGLAILPNQHSGLILNNQDPKSSSKRMMALSICCPKILELLSQGAMRALKAYNTEAINRFHERKLHNTEVVEIPQDDPPQHSVPDTGPPDLPESYLAIPDDPIPDFVNSQCHSSQDSDQPL